MSPASVRRLLHDANLIATLVLLATGFLIEWPDLRARLVGGYGRELARIHVWAGWAFMAAPMLALAVAARPLAADLRRRFGPPDPLSWRNAHLLLTLATGFALIVTGIALWWPGDLSIGLLDACAAVHSWATWVFVASIPVHLVMARRKIVERARGLLGREEPPPLFEFADEASPGDDEA